MGCYLVDEEKTKILCLGCHKMKPLKPMRKVGSAFFCRHCVSNCNETTLRMKAFRPNYDGVLRDAEELRTL